MSPFCPLSCVFATDGSSGDIISDKWCRCLHSSTRGNAGAVPEHSLNSRRFVFWGNAHESARVPFHSEYLVQPRRRPRLGCATATAAPPSSRGARGRRGRAPPAGRRPQRQGLPRGGGRCREGKGTGREFGAMMTRGSGPGGLCHKENRPRGCWVP